MYTVIPTDMAEWILTYNLQDWKRDIDNLDEVLNTNAKITDEDIHTLVSPEFYDDINSDMPVPDVLDKHYLNHLSGSRNTFITLHNLYNN